ncbi:MAG: hemolysin family protein [Candidatus Erginobacter occultus]|nr:hemolysin family protein [Candidatus Erginobacter occultus]
MNGELTILIIFFCLLLHAFFSASEMALVSVNRLRIRYLAESGSRRALMVEKTLENPETFLSTTMVGINLFLVLGATLASNLFSRRLGFGDRGVLLATVIMLPLILVFAEITPKNLSRSRATSMSLLLIYPLRFAYYILYPLVRVISWITSRILRILGVTSEVNRLFTSVDDIRLLIEEGMRQGTLSKDEERMISRVFEFREYEASDVMVPLIDVNLAPENAPVSDLRRLISESGHTRIPVYRDRVDKIIGTVQVSDLVLAGGEETIAGLIREPYIVPESKPLDELLEELRNSDVNMAIVVDEYGGVAGIVTLENIIEEIVGEIRDEYDPDEVSPFRLKGGVAEVSGRMRLDELNDALELGLPEDREEETIAGFVIDILGRIPAVGERADYGDYRFKVTQATDRRLVRLEISGPGIPQPPGPEEEMSGGPTRK